MDLAFVVTRIHNTFPPLRSVADALRFLEDATGYRINIEEGSTGSEDVPKDLEHLDALHRIASDPSSWISLDMSQRGKKKVSRKTRTASPSISDLNPNSDPNGVSSGELQRFLDHTALMSDMDDLKDKVRL